MSAPPVDDIDRISRLRDPVIRNLQITQCYHELALVMRAVVAPDANWCTYATWASRQAGVSIRQEDLVRSFEHFFSQSPEIRMTVDALSKLPGVARLSGDLDSRLRFIRAVVNPVWAFKAVSEAVSRGNLKVFVEIGHIFADYLTALQTDDRFEEARIAAFVGRLKPGGPPEGQDLLRDAFVAYHRVRFEKDKKARAELLFLANLLVGFHEQTRLQPDIAEALNVPFRDADALRDRLLNAVLPGFWLRVRRRLARLLGRELPVDQLARRLADQTKRLARRVVTDHMMTLSLADGVVLRLGRDLDGSFPEVLQEISNVELKELLGRIDPTPDSLDQSGARDWADLDERMHFITDFFRVYHENSRLFKPPFTEEQVEDLHVGRTPAGRL